MKKCLKILSIIIGIIVLLVLGFRIYLILNFENKIFEFRDYGILIEHSDKMEPEIYKDELVVIKKQKEYDLNDIIAYSNFNNILLIRKIVQIDEYGFIAKSNADNFTEPDAEINTIKGKAVYHSRILGRIFNW